MVIHCSVVNLSPGMAGVTSGHIGNMAEVSPGTPENNWEEWNVWMAVSPGMAGVTSDKWICWVCHRAWPEWSLREDVMPGPDGLQIGTATPTASCADGVVSVLVLCELGSSSNTKEVRVVLGRIKTSPLYCGFQNMTECVSINRDFVLEKEQWSFGFSPDG